MPKNTLPSGRVRNSNEQLYTWALMAELDRERGRRAMDQRRFAEFLGVHESLLSLYRSGNRFPSQTMLLDFDQKLPGLGARIFRRYYQLMRERDDAQREEAQDTASDDAPAHDVRTLVGAR